MKNARKIITDALFVAAILVISLAILSQPNLQIPSKIGSPVSDAEASSLMPEGIASLDSNGLMNKLISTDGKPTLLFIYASWCGYCKKQFPVVDALARTHGKDFKLVALSLDNNPEALLRFLSIQQQPLSFEPLILASGAEPDFENMLMSRGSNFTGGIPYTAIFTANGSLAGDFMGFTSGPEITAALGLQ